MTEHIVWFDAYVDERDRGRVGGKNASLGSMIGAGLPVPPGFAVTTDVERTGFDGGSGYWFPTSSWSVLRA